MAAAVRGHRAWRDRDLPERRTGLRDGRDATRPTSSAPTGEEPPLGTLDRLSGVRRERRQTRSPRRLEFRTPRAVTTRRRTGQSRLSAVRTSATWPMPLINLWQPRTRTSRFSREPGNAPDPHRRRRRRVAPGQPAVGVLAAASAPPRENAPPLQDVSPVLQPRSAARCSRTCSGATACAGTPAAPRSISRSSLVAPALASAHEGRAGSAIEARLDGSRSHLAAEMSRRARHARGHREPESCKFAEDNFPFLEHPLGAMEREEAFERGRRLGMETFMPFWDADLDGFLARVPPHLMNQAYWSKGLVRVQLAEDFLTPDSRRREDPLDDALDPADGRADSRSMGGDGRDQQCSRRLA